MGTSEYKKMQDGESIVFTVTPASIPPGWSGIVGFSFISLLFMYLLLSARDWLSGTTFLVCFLILVIGTYKLIQLSWTGDFRPKAHRAKSIFRVSPDSIEINRQIFNKKDIHRININNGITKNVLRPSHVGNSGIVWSGMTNADGKIITGRGLELAAIANSLELESGGKAYLLAGGMDETTVFGLQKDISNIIGI